MDDNETQEIQDNTKQEIQKDSSKTNPMMIAGIVLGIVIVVGGFFLMNRRTEPQPQTQAVEETNETATVEGLSDGDQVQEGEDIGIEIVSIEAGSFYFEPNEIRVSVGDTVRIEMTASDAMHDFVVDELGINIPVTTSGSTGIVEFVASEAGEYEYYCSISDHRQRGQTGTLIVE